MPEAQASGRQGTESEEGSARLLSHSGGYWYVISQPICESVSGKPYKEREDGSYDEREPYYYRSIIVIPEKNVVDAEIVDS